MVCHPILDARIALSVNAHGPLSSPSSYPRAIELASGPEPIRTLFPAALTLLPTRLFVPHLILPSSARTGAQAGAIADPPARPPGLSYGTWRLFEKAAESRDMLAERPRSHVSELYTSSQFGSIAPGDRFQMLASTISHITAKLLASLPFYNDGELPPEDDRPPYISAGKARPQGSVPSAWRYDQETGRDGHPVSRRTVARPGPPVPSRRDGDRAGATSPSVLIRPGIRIVASGGHVDALPVLELRDQASLLMQHLLHQLPEDEQLAACLRELDYLHKAVAKDIRVDPSSKGLSMKDWQTMATVAVTRSPHLHTELKEVLDEFEATCGDVLALRPGELLRVLVLDDETHGLERVVDKLVNKAPVISNLVQMAWMRRPTARNPLGQIRTRPGRHLRNTPKIREYENTKIRK